jgi:hypothetical protein
VAPVLECLELQQPAVDDAIENPAIDAFVGGEPSGVERTKTRVDRFSVLAISPRMASAEKSSSKSSCWWMPLPAAIDGCRRAKSSR